MTRPQAPIKRLAEWHPHTATWIAWPHHRTDWPHKLPTVRWAYGEMARILTRGERVRVLVDTPAMAAAARFVFENAGADLSQIDFLLCPTNRGWTRDFGPLFVQGKKGLTILDFEFNGWAKYRDHSLDDQVARFASDHFGIHREVPRLNGKRFVLEGGAIDCNGEGTVLTTEECLLDTKVQVRNPGASKDEVEMGLRDTLGVTQIIWLGDGIAGDDTHGHVDDFCRFVNPTTVVLAQDPNPKSRNHRALSKNRERLTGVQLANGSSLSVVELPMPAPVSFGDLDLPASYANFYIANSHVLVPTFNDPADRVALGILADLFPTRTVVGVHGRDLVLGLGGIHCLTHEEPLIPF